ncbi:hypothetical protein NHX12_008253 [Muraenolepis orangiensis]|uniref:mRNA decay activator protein ZFP36 n=1 Tax=Muraenolepis orangiensis TaxID=630683 RepID=A0A9Q0DNH9_9TELE|nr:hypothetical protein NHX12_008253 [Muraenolepis orangiensis]
MSNMLDNILTRNLLNTLALDDAFTSPQSTSKVSGPSRLNRSVSFFIPPSSSSSSSPTYSPSTEQVNNADDSSTFWSDNIWSQASLTKQLPFRPDRSMSLTESSSTLSSFSQLKGLDAFSSGPATTVAPPPGFPPSSSLLPQIQPQTLLPSNRYKTELCRGFQESGSCKYGNKCQFAHGEAELRGLYRHPKYKTEPCRTFYNFGYCPYGTRCHFIHEEKISGGLLSSAKFPNQLQPLQNGGQNPRHQLRQSVSFAGFLGSSRASPPPSHPLSFNDLNLGFSRAPSVSPPPADLLSPAPGESLQPVSAFQYGRPHIRASTGDLHNIPVMMEPKPSRCVCGHGALSRGGDDHDDGNHQDSGSVFSGSGGHHGAFQKPAVLQRFSSEDSLEDSYSSSSGGSSGSESPSFDSSANKRLTVFARLSLSD